MFGTRVYRLGENDDSKDKHKAEPIAGDFTLYLRAFNPDDKEPKYRGPFSNRVNLPQPIHMAQFVLFELGYWLIAEEGRFIWEKIDETWTLVTNTGLMERLGSIPNGRYSVFNVTPKWLTL
jgi:hypothetical protein